MGGGEPGGCSPPLRQGGEGAGAGMGGGERVSRRVCAGRRGGVSGPRRKAPLRPPAAASSSSSAARPAAAAPAAETHLLTEPLSGAHSERAAGTRTRPPLPTTHAGRVPDTRPQPIGPGPPGSARAAPSQSPCRAELSQPVGFGGCGVSETQSRLPGPAIQSPRAFPPRAGETPRDSLTSHNPHLEWPHLFHLTGQSHSSVSPN